MYERRIKNLRRGRGKIYLGYPPHPHSVSVKWGFLHATMEIRSGSCFRMNGSGSSFSGLGFENSFEIDIN